MSKSLSRHIVIFPVKRIVIIRFEGVRVSDSRQWVESSSCDDVEIPFVVTVRSYYIVVDIVVPSVVSPEIVSPVVVVGAQKSRQHGNKLGVSETVSDVIVVVVVVVAN